MFPCLAATTLCLGNFYFSGSGSSSQGQGRTKLNCQEILPLDCRGKKDNVPGEAERVKRLKDVMLRNERFNKFAKSLRPDDWESRIKVILPLIEKHAKQIWPNCTVGLHGSVLREVHNEYGSDVDIAIHTNSSCSEREFLDLCHRLTKEEDFVPLSDSSEVGKAAKFLSHGLKVDVAIQERFGVASLYDSNFIEQLKQLYKCHPEVQRAARVAKFAFPDLKGLDVEYLVCRLAEQRLTLGHTTESAQDLFLETCLEVRNFPLIPSTSPLQHLLKNVRAQHGPAAEKDLREGLRKTQQLTEGLITELNKPSKPAGDDVQYVPRYMAILAAIVIIGYMAQPNRLHEFGSRMARWVRRERPPVDIRSESARATKGRQAVHMQRLPFFAEFDLSSFWKVLRRHFLDVSFHDSVLPQVKFAKPMHKEGHLHRNHPEVQRAARVAIFAFPDLRGLDVEFYLCLLAEQRLKLGQATVSAQDLFVETCLEVRNFPLMPSTSPLLQLLEYVRAQHGPAGEEVFRETLLKTQRFADRLFHLHLFVNSGHEPDQTTDVVPLVQLKKLDNQMGEVGGDTKMDPKTCAQGRVYKNVTDKEGHLHRNHPEVQRAARVAIFAFPDLRGLDVEFYLCLLAEQRLKLGQATVSAQDLFVETCLEVRNFPLMPSTSPLLQLLEYVRAQHGPAGEEVFRETLLKTQRFADRLFHLHLFVNSGHEPPRLPEADQTTEEEV